MSGFHFPSTVREERLGKLKFGADWEGPQTKDDLDLLSCFRDPLDVYSPLEPHDYPPTPIAGWSYHGSQEKYLEACDARLRALRRQRQLAEVRSMLRLVDKYGLRPKASPEFEPLKPWEDREKLVEARRLINMPSVSVTAEPKIAPPKKDSDLTSPAPQATRKRGRKPTIIGGIKTKMLGELRQGDLTVVQLNNLLEKQLVERYGASRTTCRDARVEVLKKIKSDQPKSRAATAKRRNSDK